jgi:hypothetical protein
MAVNFLALRSFLKDQDIPMLAPKSEHVQHREPKPAYLMLMEMHI